MGSRILADLLVLLHLGFVLFVVAGGALVLRWPRLALGHIPAALWGVWIELSGGICPLTPWEKALRREAGQAAYTGDFVGHYVLPVLYPAGLTRGVQLWLGLAVLAVNLCLYGVLWRRWALARSRSRRARRPSAPFVPRPPG
jgi:hypothetical protein